MDCCIVFEGDGDFWKDSMKLKAICGDRDTAIDLILQNHKFKPEDFAELQNVDEDDDINEALANVIENHLMFDNTVKSEKRDLSYMITYFEDSCDFDEWINDVTKYT